MGGTSLALIIQVSHFAGRFYDISVEFSLYSSDFRLMTAFHCYEGVLLDCLISRFVSVFGIECLDNFTVETFSPYFFGGGCS